MQYQVIVPLLLTLSAPRALACGGLFCSSLQGIPVQQDAERILFEVHGDGTISATVEIRYQGDPDAFSWIVPVPAEPELDVAPPELLARLDLMTAPILAGQRTTCHDAPASGCSLGRSAGIAKALPLGPTLPLLTGSGCALPDLDDYDYDTGFEVTLPSQVGPYLWEIIDAKDPDAVYLWLQTNDYLVTEAMRPLIAGYVADGMKFLAMKLAQGYTAEAITPIRMTYPGTEPMVPIELTAVGAEPDMGVLVFILGDQRWQASNFTNLRIDPADIRLDPTTNAHNYPALLSWLIDQQGGEAFVTEYSGVLPVLPSLGAGPDLAEFWAERSAEFTVLTRLLTRLNAVEMNRDPDFEPSTGADVPAILDMSLVPPVEVCAAPAALAPCGASYCGLGAQCAQTTAGEGCHCTGDMAARVVGSGPNGLPRVVCEELAADVFTDAAGALLDPCVNYDCGAGSCVPINGIPACECDEGFAATVSGSAGPWCAELVGEPLGPEQILAPLSGAVTEGDGGSVVGLLLAVPLLRLRRRTPRRRAVCARAEGLGP